MNFYGLEILDEISFFVLTLFFGIIIVISWMSTKVDCDFRHVRTIILEANDQIIHNYSTSVNHTNIISVEAMISSDFATNTTNVNYEEFEENETIDTSDYFGDVNVQEACSSSNYQQTNDTKTRRSHHNSLTKNIIRLKIKYLDDREKWVFTDIKQTIFAFKRENFSEELTRDLNVRLIYNGQELKENDRILEQYGLVNNSTVHCLVTKPRSNLSVPPNHETNTNLIGGNDRNDIEIGSLMFPLFGALLAVIWYCRICYRHYFNVVTTFALIGMTIIYLIACITCFNFGSSNSSTTSYPINIHNHARSNLHRVRTNRSSATQTTRITLHSTLASF